MAKKVFIGVLAALMLFAFVACDGGTAASGTITMVEATTSKEYVAGFEYPAVSDFTFTGYTITGEKVNIPANQFAVALDTNDDPKITSIGDNEYAVEFKWANTDIPATGTFVMYDDAEYDLAVGTANVNYTAYTDGDFADPKAQKAEDFKKVSLTGLSITVSYDNGTQTKNVTVDETLAKRLSYQFGTIGADGKFATVGSLAINTYPETATGLDAIQVTLDGEEIGAYNVTVKENRVESTALVVDPEYKLYTDNKSVYEENGSSALTSLDGVEEIYVTKTMTNGQILKADADEVAYGTSETGIKAATDNTGFELSDVAITATKGEPTTVYAKFVGDGVATSYTRTVQKYVFTPITEEFAEAKITVKAPVTLAMPGEDETYDSETPVEEDDINVTTALEFSAKYNSGR